MRIRNVAWWTFQKVFKMITCSLHAILSFTATILLGSCISHLVFFLSNQGFLGVNGVEQRYPSLRSKSYRDWTDGEQQYVLTRILKDFLLVVLFIVQHSLMASERWKRLLLHFNIQICQRLLYVIASCLALNMLISGWVSTPDVMFWGLRTEEHSAYWLFFFLLHSAAWLILFLQVALMDPLELVGLKQVYNYYKRRDAPLDYLPKQLRMLYQHLRHAGTSSLWAVLWLHPVMTLDRFLLALMLTLYLALAHQVSLADYKFAHSYFVLEKITTTSTKHQVYQD